LSDDASFWTTIFATVDNRELTNEFDGLGVGVTVVCMALGEARHGAIRCGRSKSMAIPRRRQPNRALNRADRLEQRLLVAYAAANAVDGDCIDPLVEPVQQPAVAVCRPRPSGFAIDEVKLTWSGRTAPTSRSGVRRHHELDARLRA